MAVPVVMPKLGNSVESSIIVAWKKHAGERVNEGDVIAEVETDKAVQEITAPSSGVLLATFYAVGDDVPVMVNIAAIGDMGESVDSLRTGNLTPQPSLATAEEGSLLSRSNSSSIPERMSESAFVAVSPRARGLALRRKLALSGIVGTGPGGRIIERDLIGHDVQAALERQPKLTPVAQAKVSGGEYSAPAQGSGVGGRITTRDLIPKFAIDTPQPPDLYPLAADSALQVSAAPKRTLIADANGAKVTVLKGVRKVIAARMLESLRTTAQLTLNSSADARALQAYRRRLKDSADTLGLRGVTINDLVMYATAHTLMQFPDLNAHLKDSAITQYNDIQLGFAVDTPRGLIVPVIKDAATLSLRQLAAAAARLAAACQSGTLKPDELDGGTFTVSNLGSLGIESFTPVLNPPQVGILGVGAIQLKPVDVDGETQFIPHIGLSLTIDHQAVDGAPGARFLQALARNIAQFDLMLAL
ncbi:MAG: dihydrolipoamide acetyltransferase family protein [Chloroflexota bacterium]|nr:dihydrolipoamide acetyltransferase family protein [Chloroflexota bacterium]